MRKTPTIILGILLATTTFFTAGCTKDEEEKTDTSSNPTKEGIYLGIVGFNSELYIKDISLLNSSTVSSFTNFINDLSAGNGTGLYYADYTALKKMKEYNKPPKLKNVALVTFTDGLDNVSTAGGQYNPENYNSTTAYREALHNKIANEKIHGINVSAYTIGLKGNDVTDEAVFMETLQKLASNENNVFQVADMNEAMQRFSQIASDLYSVSKTVSLGVNVPGGYDDGQLLRFTFDNGSSASESTKYIEATYHRNGNSRTLDNITYHGFAQGATSITASSSQGAYFKFVFDNLTNTDGSLVDQTTINKILLWKRTSTGSWDKETEFDPSRSTDIKEDKSSALIVLVLDCTTSLGSDFSKMKQAGVNFVRTLAASGNNGGSNNGGSNNGGNNGGGNNSGNDNGGNNGGSTGSQSLRLVFDGVTTNVFGYMAGAYKPNDDEVLFRHIAAANWSGNNLTFPYYYCLLSYDETNGWSVETMEYGNNASEINALTEYFEETTGNWWFYSLLNGSMIDNFDATNLTISYTFHAQMRNAYEYYILGRSENQVTMKTLDVYASNIRLTRID